MATQLYSHIQQTPLYDTHEHTNKENQLFVSSLINIATGLNIKVIAEMVETEAESVALNKLGVEHQQGYYFAKPALWNVY